jgi:hypothetical protein
VLSRGQVVAQGAGEDMANNHIQELVAI